MRVTGWRGGQGGTSGAGYGLRVSYEDRGRYFSPTWGSISIALDGGSVITVRLSDSFWRQCSELRSAAPWPKGEPPRMMLRPLAGNRFELSA